MLKMTQAKKGIVLRQFFEHNMACTSCDVQKKKCAEIADQVKGENGVRPNTKNKIQGTHIETFRRNYSFPLTECDGREMLYKMNEEGYIMRDRDGDRVLDENTINRHDHSFPDTKAY